MKMRERERETGKPGLSPKASPNRVQNSLGKVMSMGKKNSPIRYGEILGPESSRSDTTVVYLSSSPFSRIVLGVCARI